MVIAEQHRLPRATHALIRQDGGKGADMV
jgi:hypothetical protein